MQKKNSINYSSREGNIKNFKKLSIFYLSFIFYLLPFIVFSQEPIILPPVTITGQDKSTDLFERVERSPGPALKEELPKGSGLKGTRPSPSLFSVGLFAGGYDYLEWKVMGGKETGLNFLLFLNRIKTGNYGIPGKLQRYSKDNFNIDFSFPFLNNHCLFSSLRYYERDEFITHSIFGGNTLEHHPRKIGIGAGWRGRIGNLNLVIGPEYSYTVLDDKRFDVDTDIIAAEEFKGGIKAGVNTQLFEHFLSGEIYYENENRKNLSQPGNNFTVYIGDIFRIARIPSWKFKCGARYFYLYRFNPEFNFEIDICSETKNGIAFNANLKRESVLPDCSMFLENYVKFAPDLKVQNSWIADLGAKGRLAAIEGNLRGLWNAGILLKTSTNFIAYGDTDSRWQPFPIPIVNQFGPYASVELRYPFLSGEIAGKFELVHREATTLDTSRIPHFPKDEIAAKIGYDMENFKIFLTGNYRGGVYSDTSVNAREIPGYFITNLSVSFDIKKGIRLLVEGENLFDVPYEILSYYPVKGRNFRGGVEIKF